MAARENKKYIYRALCNTLIVFIVSGLYAFVWQNHLNPMLDRPYLKLGQMAMIVIYAALSIFMIAVFNGFKIGVSRKSHAIMSQAFAMGGTNVISLVFAVMMIGRMKLLGEITWWFVKLYVVQVAALFVTTWFVISLYRKLFPPYNMLQIHGEHENGLATKMNLRDDKYRVTGGISAEEDLDKIYRTVDKYDAVLINDVPAQRRNDILKYCFSTNKRAYFTPKISDVLVKESDEMDLFDSPLYLNRNIGMPLPKLFVKRMMDIVLSLIGIIFSSPFMIFAAIAIHLYDKGPVFYKQVRYTKDRREFEILKFRSMIVDAEKKSGARLATADDDRITPVGHFIRKTRIDELPQFFNILKGDMSFVGPRPERPEIHKEYVEKVPEFDYRLRVKAGLTGYAQVYGKYNTTTYDKLKFDMIYVQKASIALDVRLILLTMKVVFQKESTEGIEEGKKNAG